MILHYGKKALVTTDAFSWISMGFSKRICTASTARLIHKIHVDIHKFCRVMPKSDYHVLDQIHKLL